MSVLSDTTADAAAALHAPKPLPGENEPPVTLSGLQAYRTRNALRNAFARIEKIEPTIKLWREREALRTVRIALGAALAYFPEPPPAPAEKLFDDTPV